MFAWCRWLVGLPFAVIARIRGFAYDHGLFAVKRADLPVISVGNLSVGGTGKTPLVIYLVARLRELGWQPAVLARGYGRRPGDELNDEGKLLRMRFPDLLQVQNPDRVAGAAEITQQGKADLIILDDAFQHRRLHRDLDLVCLDATKPWYADAMLPGGRLRESGVALRRANLLAITRSGGLKPEARRQLVARAQVDSSGRPTCFCRHQARDLLSPDGESLPIQALCDQRVFLFAGIAGPGAFAATVEECGGQVVGLRSFPDHGCFGAERLHRLQQEFAASGAKWLLTTEKDLARAGEFPFPVYTLRIDLVVDEGSENLEVALGYLEKLR